MFPERRPRRLAVARAALSRRPASRPRREARRASTHSHGSVGTPQSTFRRAPRSHGVRRGVGIARASMATRSRRAHARCARATACSHRIRRHMGACSSAWFEQWASAGVAGGLYTAAVGGAERRAHCRQGCVWAVHNHTAVQHVAVMPEEGVVVKSRNSRKHCHGR